MNISTALDRLHYSLSWWRDTAVLTGSSYESVVRVGRVLPLRTGRRVRGRRVPHTRSSGLSSDRSIRFPECRLGPSRGQRDFGRASEAVPSRRRAVSPTAPPVLQSQGVERRGVRSPPSDWKTVFLYIFCESFFLSRRSFYEFLFCSTNPPSGEKLHGSSGCIAD